MKKAVVVVVLILGISLTAFAGALDKFMANYGAGNLHTLFFTDPVNLIKLLGEEPTSYDFYSSGRYHNQYIFTYVKPDSHGELKSLAIIWEFGSIEEIRVGFAEGTTVEDVLKILGYTQDFFPTQEMIGQRLGNVPYHAQIFTAENAVNKAESSIQYDLKLIFLLNHFDDSVYMLIAQYD